MALKVQIIKFIAYRTNRDKTVTNNLIFNFRNETIGKINVHFLGICVDVKLN